MKAIVLRAFGSEDELWIANIPTPEIKTGEVLIKVRSISINPVDVKTRKGAGQAARLKEDDPMILGWDVSGEIVESKAGAGFKTGDEVFGMINIPGVGKAYAEFVAAPAHQIAIKPPNISHEEAASAGIAAMTAWQATVTHGKVTAGQRVLIHAASGGVGHYAVQIAKQLGAHVIGTSSGANRDFVLGLGADEHVDYTLQPFEEIVQEVDFVLDAIGGDHIDRSLKVLKKKGTIIALPSGLSESVQEKAAVQGKHGIFFMVKSNGSDMKQLAFLLDNGDIRSFISKKYAFDEIQSAHRQMESGRTIGKLVVTI